MRKLCKSPRGKFAFLVWFYIFVSIHFFPHSCIHLRFVCCCPWSTSPLLLHIRITRACGWLVVVCFWRNIVKEWTSFFEVELKSRIGPVPRVSCISVSLFFLSPTFTLVPSPRLWSKLLLLIAVVLGEEKMNSRRNFDGSSIHTLSLHPWWVVIVDGWAFS